MRSVYFRSKFWGSDSVRILSPKEKLVYFYLITCDEIPPSGIFRFYPDDHCGKLRMQVHELNDSIGVLAKAGKVICEGNWIFVVKFLKEAFDLPEKLLSKNIKKNIEKQLRDEKIPEKIIDCFYEVSETLYLTLPQYRDRDRDRDKRISSEQKKSSLTGGEKEMFEIKIPLKDKTSFLITDLEIQELTSAYPDVDIIKEVKKIRAWNVANESKRKTRKGFMRHVNNWISRVQEKIDQNIPTPVNDIDRIT